MEPVLRKMLSDRWPGSIEGSDWIIITHSGKADLQTNLIRKMRSWSFNDPYFIILRDNDGGDCRAIKHDLLNRAEQAGKPHSVRIVCQELEAWFLGDLAAVGAAFPGSKATQRQTKSNARNPDVFPNASQLIEQLTGSAAKVGRAQIIAQHLNISANRSPSFRLLVSTIDSLVSRRNPPVD